MLFFLHTLHLFSYCLFSINYLVKVFSSCVVSDFYTYLYFKFYSCSPWPLFFLGFGILIFFHVFNFSSFLKLNNIHYFCVIATETSSCHHIVSLISAIPPFIHARISLVVWVIQCFIFVQIERHPPHLSKFEDIIAVPSLRFHHLILSCPWILFSCEFDCIRTSRMKSLCLLNSLFMQLLVSFLLVNKYLTRVACAPLQ